MSEDLTLEQRFNAFDQANPHIYTAIFAYAYAKAHSGYRRIAIAALFESIREDMRKARAKGEVKESYEFNNSYRAFYARKLLAERPDLFEGVIHIRKQKEPKK